MKDLGLPEDRCYVIAEVAQAHDGSLGQAHAYIDAIGDSGADAVKFQTHIASAESTLQEPWRIPFSPQDETRFEYWRRMEFTPDQWAGLARHARERDLEFLSSPFSTDAVDLLNKLNVRVWKIPSGETNNPVLLDAVWSTGRPVLYSSGMTDLSEMAELIELTRLRGIPYGVFQCSSSYPCPPELWGLQTVEVLRQTFGCPAGFSDHSGGIYAGLAAAALGANFIEVHVTFSRQMFGPDVSSSITIAELRQLVEGVRLVHTALRANPDKTTLPPQIEPLKNIFGHSLALTHDMAAGSVINQNHLTLKKPAGGIAFAERNTVVGRRLRVDKSATQLLSFDDFE